ncbi:hypothetical protein ACFLIM_48125 [Nonomuraea sp. M3C6]|uniref:Uncharacterized protein n=1 Tax=Nonomuraea marmarensis TaxID=3351344 RepID=A0ABW7AXJ1_9ACTN
MSRISAKIAAVLIALAAGLVAISTLTAGPANAIPPACHDGFVLWNIYHDMGDEATASAILSNLRGMGCLDPIEQ